MGLLGADVFSSVFERLRGKRIGLVQPVGNVGDRLIDWATRQMLDLFGISWQIVDPNSPPDVDELVFGGGGNMGTVYQCNWKLRGRILKYGIPITIFPQSFTTQEDRPYRQVFVRERGSLRYCAHGVLAPDLALGLNYRTSTRPRYELGVFLRNDIERSVQAPRSKCDPAAMCGEPSEYLELAAQYERIVTDRLHFAICGLIVGRHTTLLPNAYHKNRSMHETWLGALGCRFAVTLTEAIAANGFTMRRRWFGRWIACLNDREVFHGD